MEDLDFEEPWLVVDVLLKEGASDELPATNVQFCEPERPTTFVVGPGNHRRWEFMVNPGESLDDLVQPETIRSLVGRWLEPDEYDVWRAATYRFYALISEQWRVGNIFFLGDSAHMTPPFLAQGMCQGIRDAMNLVWKLALVHRGVAATALLDSYHLERAPHVRRTTEIAKGFGELVCERDLDRAAARDQILLAELAAAPQGTLRDSLIPPLVTGYLDDDAPAGALFPQPRVTDSTGREDLLDRFTGQNFRLVLGVGYENAPELDALVSTYGTHIPLSVVRLTDDAPAAQDEYRERDGILSRWLEKYGARAVLVRPDHYVFGSATDHAETIGLLERGLGGLVRRDGVPA
jgi:3-(3-hydroxy-phenyl)propionate hydroxylase